MLVGSKTTMNSVSKTGKKRSLYYTYIDVKNTENKNTSEW